jgi:predicted nucleotidyltransferase
VRQDRCFTPVSVRDALLAVGGPIVQQIRLFGSYATNTQHSDSDIDVLLVVEPDGTWGPRENLALRRRCEAALHGCPVRVELLVRTTAQYADASRVFGGVEYWARHARAVLYERPVRRRFVLPLDTKPTKARLTAEAFGHAVELLDTAKRDLRSEASLVNRALNYAVLAVTIRYGCDVLRKSDPLSRMLVIIGRLAPPLTYELAKILTRSVAVTASQVALALDVIACHLAEDVEVSRLIQASQLSRRGRLVSILRMRADEERHGSR